MPAVNVSKSTEKKIEEINDAQTVSSTKRAIVGEAVNFLHEKVVEGQGSENSDNADNNLENNE